MGGRLRLSLVGMLALWLSGCSGLTPTPEVPPDAWATRLVRLQTLNHWRVSGRVAARDADHGWSGQFTWTQTAQHYRLSLQGPLHQQGILIEGDAAAVRARLADGTQLIAPDAETLLAQQLGLALPVTQLRAWILGIPSAATPAVLQEFNAEAQLKALEQADWRIDYSAYQSVGGLDLPKRIELSHEALQARIILDAWQLP